MPQEKVRILLVFDCQAESLARCLEYLAPQIEVSAFHFATYQKQREEILSRPHDFLIGLPSFIADIKDREFESHPKRITLSPIRFWAFQPDIIVLRNASGPVKSDMDDYHSLILFLSFINQLSEEEAISMFNPRTFMRLGYYKEWERSLAYHKRNFDSIGWDTERFAATHASSGSFMHSYNHPKVQVLAAFAFHLAKHLGLDCSQVTDPPIPDTLAFGPVWPVYPEIATHYGTSGHYRFKPANTFRWHSLEEFTALSYENFRSLNVEEILSHTPIQPSANAFRSLL